jgi:hypothetical protein
MYARPMEIYELSPIRQQTVATLETNMYFKDFQLRSFSIQPRSNAKNLDEMLGTVN